MWYISLSLAELPEQMASCVYSIFISEWRRTRSCSVPARQEVLTHIQPKPPCQEKGRRISDHPAYHRPVQVSGTYVRLGLSAPPLTSHAWKAKGLGGDANQLFSHRPAFPTTRSQTSSLWFSPPVHSGLFPGENKNIILSIYSMEEFLVTCCKAQCSFSWSICCACKSMSILNKCLPSIAM